MVKYTQGKKGNINAQGRSRTGILKEDGKKCQESTLTSYARPQNLGEMRKIDRDKLNSKFFKAKFINIQGHTLKRCGVPEIQLRENHSLAFKF